MKINPWIVVAALVVAVFVGGYIGAAGTANQLTLKYERLIEDMPGETQAEREARYALAKAMFGYDAVVYGFTFGAMCEIRPTKPDGSMLILENELNAAVVDPNSGNDIVMSNWFEPGCESTVTSGE